MCVCHKLTDLSNHSIKDDDNAPTSSLELMSERIVNHRFRLTIKATQSGSLSQTEKN